MIQRFDARPIIVAIAGPNGAGKTTFFHAHLAPAALRFVNADELAREMGVTAYEAAQAASEIRKTLVEERESFIFETVLSDPVGEKVAFLQKAAAGGYTIVFCFIGIDSVEISEERVAMRTLQGGHDVPSDKLAGRFPRTLENLARAIEVLPHVLLFDNSDLARPFRKVAEFRDGELISDSGFRPAWFRKS
ncbi:MAG: Zeta toxin [bacterium]|nr:Zeta toxin [bacterium]